MMPTTLTATTARELTGVRRQAVRMLLRPLPPALPRAGRVAVRAGMLYGAAMLVASAAIHLHLWLIGYRYIHLIGPAFLVQAVSGFALAAALLAARRVVAVAAGAAYLIGSAGALFLSATVGFLGLHDGLNVPWTHWALFTELSGFMVLAACLLGSLARPR